MSDMGEDHAALMDRTYRVQRRFYDLTRAWFLLGRDRLIADLDAPAGARVLEVACGTGRNLAEIGRWFPGVHLHGLDISQEMLKSARARLEGRAELALADAAGFDAQALFGQPGFERVVLSYSLSMIPEWEAALEAALDCVAPGGSLHVVDFGDQADLPGWFRLGLRAWLARFHVSPRADLFDAAERLAARSGTCCDARRLFRGYAWSVTMTRPG